MKYFILPLDEAPANNSSWTTDDPISLGGYFYDHLKTSNGNFIDIRYYIDNDIKPKNHPVFQRFIKYHRFFFDWENGFIDILLNATHKEEF